MVKTLQKLLFCFSLAISSFAYIPTGSGELAISDVTAPGTRIRVRQWSLAGVSGASKLTINLAYSTAAVVDPSRQLTCTMPCSMVVDTTQSLFYQLVYKDSSGNTLVTGPVETF